MDSLFSTHGPHDLQKAPRLIEGSGWLDTCHFYLPRQPFPTPSLGPGDAIPPAAPRGRCWAGSSLSRPPRNRLSSHSSERCVQPALWAPGALLAPSAPQQSVSALARLDGDMGVPTVPEASNPRWGTLLLAIFLAASRGKIHRRWGTRESARDYNPVGQWGLRQDGVP